MNHNQQILSPVCLNDFMLKCEHCPWSLGSRLLSPYSQSVLTIVSISVESQRPSGFPEGRLLSSILCALKVSVQMAVDAQLHGFKCVHPQSNQVLINSLGPRMERRGWAKTAEREERSRDRHQETLRHAFISEPWLSSVARCVSSEFFLHLFQES